MQQHQTKGISDFHKLVVTVVKTFCFWQARSKKKKKKKKKKKEKKKKKKKKKEIEKKRKSKYTRSHIVNFITKELTKTIMNRSTK